MIRENCFERSDFDRMIAQEHMMLDCLEEKNVPDRIRNLSREELQDFYLMDSLRQVKDNLIIFTALCARTAIRKGASVNVSKRTESSWIHSIENLQSLDEASEMVRAMYTSFQRLIQNAGEAEGLSRAVRECRDYIRMNYSRNLRTEDIARHCGYTEYYLTRKFARETGMKLTDYIRCVRVDAAKVMLLTSKRDIQTISEELQFCSRSYFDRVFLREVGMSPKQYREAMGRVAGEKKVSQGT